MKRSLPRLILFMVAIGVVALLIWFRISTSGHPVALIRVVDATGKPIAGAIIRPNGARAKAGTYSSRWYDWKWPMGPDGVPATAHTGNDGTATIPYPRFLFERIEAGILYFNVDHPEFVPALAECYVDTSPPAGSPMPVLLNYWWGRIRQGALTARPNSIVLKKGGILKLVVRPDAAGPPNVPLFAGVSGLSMTDSSWLRPEPNVLMTRRLAPGPFFVRAVKVDTNGTAWFSQAVTNSATIGQTNFVEVSITRGFKVHGELDTTVPRPVRNGRVIAHVWPKGGSKIDFIPPPQWHAWAKVRDDGRFEFASLPAGDLEIVALCDGFVSTNGPGEWKFRYPQNHIIRTSDLAITIGMEPTARLEVFVSDDKGKPLKDANVLAWPKVRYGEWFSTVLASDCYNSADMLLTLHNREMFADTDSTAPVFSVKSDSNGLAVLPNLPTDVKGFIVQHERFALPAIMLPGWGKAREATITLIAGETNHASVQLEPRDQSPIKHY